MAILKDAPEGAQVLDLNAARAARIELSSKSFIKLTAGYIETKAEVPLSAAFAINTGDIAGALGQLLADPTDVDALIADGLTSGDIEAITIFIAGKPVGESKA
jgi:hypothetical protein